MAYCCVPLCRSDAKKKPPGVSFHEIPADTDAREQWLKCIKRDNWVPNATSNYSKVCSRHFTNADFVEGKRRRLKKGAVPSVFPDYPSHLRPRQVSERGDSSIRKRKLANDTCGVIDSGKRIQLAQTVVLPEEEFEVDQTLSMHTDSTVGLGEGLTQAVTADMQSKAPQPAQRQDQATQVDNLRKRDTTALERSRWNRKLRDMRNIAANLRRTVDSYKEELGKLKEDSLYESIQYIKERAEESNPSALFLLEQVSNFKKSRPSWSEDTIHHSVILRHLSTKTYEHLRTVGLLKLPCRNTLNNYLGTTSGETGFNSLVESVGVAAL